MKVTTPVSESNAVTNGGTTTGLLPTPSTVCLCVTICQTNRAALILVSIGIEPLSTCLMILEWVKYVLQEPILLLVHY